LINKNTFIRILYISIEVFLFGAGGVHMGYSYRKFAGIMCIVLAATILIRVLPAWAWYTVITLFIASICYLIYISLFG